MRPLVVIIDEYADLVAVLGKKEREDFERVISRLAARGRNVGIHLILATQRPTADIVTGNIKANMGCRISFSLPSSRDSQVVLDDQEPSAYCERGICFYYSKGSSPDCRAITSILQRSTGYYALVTDRNKQGQGQVPAKQIPTSARTRI
jgi:DNA segregation ATPase FtsK/SpoIIIE-like protein